MNLPFDDKTLTDLVSVITANGFNQEWNDLMDRLTELEAENRIFRSTESVDDSVWDALLEQVRVLQVKLDRVGELKPFVLSDDQTFVVYYDELESALEGKDDE